MNQTPETASIVDRKNITEVMPLCDYDHSTIRCIISKIITDDMNEIEKARAVFFYVRDNIKYAVGGAGFFSHASKVFKIGYGDCGSKTNAHMALLHAVNIPTRMHGAMADASVLKDFMPKWIYNLATRKSCRDYHFWTECYLNDRWVACDALLDQPLYEKCIEKSILTKEIMPSNDWDGKSDFTPLKSWIIEDFGTRPSWDAWSATYLKFIMPGVPKFALTFFELFFSPISRNATNKIRAD